MGNIVIRKASPDDAEELVSIYAPYVLKTAITCECEVPSAEEFRKRISHTLENYPYLVAEEDGNILGYVYTSPMNPRYAYRFSVETSIYIRSDVRHKGVGKKLYAAVERISAMQHITNMNACIAVPSKDNESTPYLTTNSRDFHHHMGYRLVGEFRNCVYKFGQWFDIIWMEKIIGKHENQPLEFVPFSKL